MATRNEQSTKRTRNRILEAAGRVLARRGYHDTNVEEVVTKSGTSKGGFYFHFPSKERMVVALVEEMSDKLVKKVERAMNGEPLPERRLAIALDTLLRTFSRQRKLAQVLLINMAGHGKSMDKKFLPVRNRFAEVIQRELDGAVAAGLVQPMDTTLASQVWLGALHEVIFQWLMADNPTSIEDIVPQTGAMLFSSAGIPGERFVETLAAS